MKHNVSVSISIFNRPGSFFFKGCLVFWMKKVIRKVMKIQRGPDVVLKSLTRGLDKTNTRHNVNPNLGEMSETVHVISNVEALKWAIQEKKAGKIKTLVTGPNITLLPSDDGKILCDPAIDIILLPSEWTKDAYAKDCPEIEGKIKVWPSGVEIPEQSLRKKNTFIVFKKQYDENAYNKIIEKLEQSQVQFKVLVYGSFNQRQYFDLLEEAKGMIYLQKSESQGIALQEAWARNVPTLVSNSLSYTYAATNVTVSGQISAPYLTNEAGMFFDNSGEFPKKLTEFIEKIETFTPREYCIKKLSDEASARTYIEHIFK